MPSSKQKSQFYHTLATLYEAGVSFDEALRNHVHGRLRKHAFRAAEAMRSEQIPLHEALQCIPGLSNLEINLVKAGEKTGRLADSFHNLSRWFEQLAMMKRSLISKLLYPLLQFHIVILILCVYDFFMPSDTPPAVHVIKFIYLSSIPYFLYFVFKRLNQEWLFNSKFFGTVLTSVPLVGKMIRKNDYARFLFSFSQSHAAGLGAAESVRIGAASCVNGRTRSDFLKAALRIDHENIPFSEAFSGLLHKGNDSSLIFSMLRTGEQSGKLAETSLKLSQMFQNDVLELMKRAAIVFSLLFYLVIVVFIAYKVISMWIQHLSVINDIIDGV